MSLSIRSSRSRVFVSLTVGDEDELEEDDHNGRLLMHTSDERDTRRVERNHVVRNERQELNNRDEAVFSSLGVRFAVLW